MGAQPAEIPDENWLTWPSDVRELTQAQHQEIKRLRAQVTRHEGELGRPLERIGRSSRNASETEVLERSAGHTPLDASG
jgi:hypothetical protein